MLERDKKKKPNFERTLDAATRGARFNLWREKGAGAIESVGDAISSFIFWLLEIDESLKEHNRIKSERKKIRKELKRILVWSNDPSRKNMPKKIATITFLHAFYDQGFAGSLYTEAQEYSFELCRSDRNYIKVLKKNNLMRLPMDCGKFQLNLLTGRLTFKREKERNIDPDFTEALNAMIKGGLTAQFIQENYFRPILQKMRKEEFFDN